MSDPNSRGRFVWYDLFTSDPARAIEFYTKITDWGTQEWKSEHDASPYVMWTVGERPVGGVMQLPAQLAASGLPPHWLGYVSVPDVDETTAQVKSLGGTVLHGPMDIPPVGRIVTFADPQGAVIAAFTATASTPDHAGPATVGEFSWHELVTTDYAAAFDFYAALFGWERTSSFDMGPMGTYQMYGRDGVELGGMFNKPADMPMPPHWLYYVQVENTDRASERVVELGGRTLNGPMDVPGGGRIAQCDDPQGGAFALHSIAK